MNPIDKLAWIEIKNRKVLFLRSRGKNVFFSPGGKRESGETDEQVLRREIHEELTAELVPETVQYLETFTAQAAGQPEGLMVKIACYTAAYQGVLTASAEIEELAWFTSADAPRTTIAGRLILQYLKEKDLID